MLVTDSIQVIGSLRSKMPASHGSVLLISDEAEVPRAVLLSKRSYANRGTATLIERHALVHHSLCENDCCEHVPSIMLMH